MSCGCEPQAGPAEREAGKAFYSTAKKLELRLSGLGFAAYLAGDAAQRWAFDHTERAGALSTLGTVVSGLAVSTLSVLRTYGGAHSRRIATGEIRNNLFVFQLVRDSPAKLGIPPAGPIPLLRIVERAYSAGSYPALWLIEGLGHDWASRARELGHPLEDLLARGEAAHLPEETLTMMHAGIGLSFAEFLLPRLTPLSAPQTFREVLGEFAGLCARNSRPGYEGAALESLGLVTRVWHPELRDLVDCALTRDFPHLRSFFWHGVGRALFFNPVYLLPGLLSPWREAAAAADPVARLNMRAGLAWAFTLVNMREPEIVEDFVREHGEELERDGGFANGVASTLTMRHDITPQDASLDGLLAHRPAPAAAMHWERLVRGPARAAVERYQPVLRRCRALEQVFHFAALPEVVRRLERSCSAA